jgi:glycosyltransferase involved in cell wall biosynthesis
MKSNLDIKFSIITPCYNSVDTIRATIESVLSQNYNNIEYIIIDGGSTDGTLEVIHEYIASLSIISEQDDGIADAMNKGIKMSSGDVIGILNADDVYLPGALLKVSKYITTDNNSVVHGDMYVVFPNSNLSYESIASDSPDFSKGMVIHHPAMFIPKKIMIKYGYYDTSLKITMDWELCLRYSKNNVNFIHCDNFIVKYVVGGLSTIHSFEVFSEMHLLRKRYHMFQFIDIAYLKHSILSFFTFGRIILISHMKRAILK